MEITAVASFILAVYSLIMSNIVFNFTKSVKHYKREFESCYEELEYEVAQNVDLKREITTLQTENDKLNSQIKQYENKIKTITEFFGKTN